MITEKQFIVKKSGSGLFYRDGDYEIDNTTQFIIEIVEMKLNQLSDENEQLRKENDMFSCELSVSANKEISRNCRIAELEEENEQLKFENNELKCALALNEVDYIIADGKKIDIPPYYEFEQRYDHVIHRREYDGYD